MLPKEYRLPSSTMRDVLRSGRRSGESFVSLTVKKNNTPLSRFGFIVSTKVDKRATTRNRLKRLLRESVHHLLAELPKGWDVVVSTRSKPHEDMNQSDVEKILRQALQNAGVLRG